jgi:hypothetical protein
MERHSSRAFRGQDSPSKAFDSRADDKAHPPYQALKKLSPLE